MIHWLNDQHVFISISSPENVNVLIFLKKDLQFWKFLHVDTFSKSVSSKHVSDNSQL